jgi:hypothetical protein
MPSIGDTRWRLAWRLAADANGVGAIARWGEFFSLVEGMTLQFVHAYEDPHTPGPAPGSVETTVLDRIA